MKNTKLMNNILCGIMLFCTCAASKPESELVFSFYYHEKKIFIGSKNYPKGGGDPYNIIVSDDLNIKAIDYNQDKTIDEVVEGNISKQEVQKIYDFGLNEAAKKGALKQREWEFIYEYRDEKAFYEIRSYVPLKDVPYNEFYISRPLGIVIKTLDSNSDGTIDYILLGDQYSTMDEVQKEYIKVLDKGIKENKIEKVDGLYHVKPKYQPDIKEDNKKIIIEKSYTKY